MLLKRPGSQPSIKGTSMTHIAIQEALDGKNVDWLEPVTDEQYLIGPRRCSWSAPWVPVDIGSVGRKTNDKFHGFVKYQA
jgi:hypothetical protein